MLRTLTLLVDAIFQSKTLRTSKNRIVRLSKACCIQNRRPKYHFSPDEFAELGFALPSNLHRHEGHRPSLWASSICSANGILSGLANCLPLNLSRRFARRVWARPFLCAWRLGIAPLLLGGGIPSQGDEYAPCLGAAFLVVAAHVACAPSRRISTAQGPSMDHVFGPRLIRQLPVVLLQALGHEGEKSVERDECEACGAVVGTQAALCRHR